MPAPLQPEKPAAGLSGAAVTAGLGLFAGLALPVDRGIVASAAVLAVVLALTLARARTTPGPDALATLPRAQRWALGALLLAPLVPLTTLAARTLAAVAVAFPAAVWATVPAVLAALVLPRCRRTWSFGPVLALLVLGTAGAGWFGARFEAAGAHAHGTTWSGPILGIHPFQATAVIVDGHGPFDLPINDFVEPDGRRGYGPEALAAALERDLHAIAEQQFAEFGPARAHAAFAGATVVAEQLPEVRERLDRPSEQPTEPRLRVTSGGVGRRSRVEFVCPGSPVDPRPRRPDTVMERMCPDKYAAEASAGLGLTGRWTGYTEQLGQPRASLGRLLGLAPGDLRGELRLDAWLALLLLLPVLAAPSGRPAAGLARWAGATALTAAVLAVLFIAPGLSVQAPATMPPGTAGSPWQLAPWLAALALGAGHAALVGSRHLATPPVGARPDDLPAPAGPPSDGAAAGSRSGHAASRPDDLPSRRLALTDLAALAGPLLRAVPLLAATLGLAGGLAASTFLVPELAPRGESGLDADARMLPAERLIAGLGDALHRAAGLDLDVAEALVAATAFAVILGLLAALLGPGVRAAGIALRPERPLWAGRAALAAVLVPGALLVLSRKTAGGAALLAPAIAVMWTAGAALALVGARRARGLRIVDLLLSLALVALALVQALAARGNDMMWILSSVLGLAAAGALLLVRSPSDPPGPPSGT